MNIKYKYPVDEAGHRVVDFPLRHVGETVSAHCDVATGLVDYLRLRVKAYFAHPFIESGIIFLFLLFLQLFFCSAKLFTFSGFGQLVLRH